MIVRGIPYFKLCRFIDRGLIGVSILGFFVIFFALLMPSGNEEDLLFSFEESHREKRDTVTSIASYEGVGEGALALSVKNKEIPFPHIDREIRFLGESQRPDLKRAPLLLSLKQGGDTVALYPGEKMYVEFDGDSMVLKKEPTPFWIVPEVIKNGNLLFKGGLKVKRSGGAFVEESFHFRLKKQAEKVSSLTSVEKGSLDLLKRGEWFGEDLLFKKYGGESYLKKKEKNRFQIGSDSKFLFLSDGDFIVYDGKHWRNLREGENSRDYSLAKVVAMDDHAFEVVVWDQKGVEIGREKLSKTRVRPFRPKVKRAFQRIRLRTRDSVSCRIERKSVILKKGDWLLFGKGGARALKSKKDVDSYLNYQVIGELFVFDGVEKVGGDKIFKGHFFDPTRSFVEEVLLKVTEKQNRKKERDFPLKKLLSPSYLGE